MVQFVDPTDFYRFREGLGVWPYRGKVAAVGIGHSPTLRRWDRQPETSVGAWCILAIRKAIEDAGVPPAEVDTLVLSEDTSSGAYWPEGDPIPEDFLAAFEQTGEPTDGLTQLSTEWLLKNMPELTGIKTVVIANADVSISLAAAIEAVGRGLGSVAVVVKGWHNFEGKYHQGGANVEEAIDTPGKYGFALGGTYLYPTAIQFQRYLHKYGKTKEMFAPFVINSRDNGLLFPEGYWAQHRPVPISVEEYFDSRWICEPANLLDNDMPIHTAGAWIITTAERAQDMQQKPVYFLGHAGAGSIRDGRYGGVAPRSTIQTLEEAEEQAAATGRKLYEAAGITAADVEFENAYDGYTLFHVFHLEGLGFAGIGRGEALDYFASQDISIRSDRPISPSGGNIGSGRTRYWIYTDTIQQIQGRAGARQVRNNHLGVAGGMLTDFSNFFVMSSTPDA